MERLRSECILCILEKQLVQLSDEKSESEKVEFLQRMFKVFAEAPKDAGAPLLVRKIDDIKKEMFHIEDEYGEIKKHFNDVMLEYEDMVRQKIKDAQDPLKVALQYALIGNYIDFGAMKNVEEDTLKDLLSNLKRFSVREEEYEAFQKDLAKRNSLLFITDNCGEIVMDKLMIETIKEYYPKLEIRVMVRGDAVLNDATMEDAKQVGMTKVANVYGNGTAIAGTCVEQLSKEALEVFHAADIMIAKGQGNFETLRYCGKNIYYLFLCKCDMFAKQFQVPKLTGILINDKNL